MPTVYKENLLDTPVDKFEIIPPRLEAEKLLESPHDMLLSANYQDSIPGLEASQQIEDKDDPLRTLISWKAMSRPYKKRNRSFYTTVAILVVLFSPIALFLGGKTLFLALAALGFVVYIFNLVPPEEIDYKLSTQGLTIGDHFYHWQEMDSFWVTQKDHNKMLNILTRFKFPMVLMVILDPAQEEKIKRVAAEYLPFHEIVPKSIMEKWAEGLQKHFPLENPNH